MSFARRKYSLENLHIVWLVSPFVSGAVNQPGDIQDESPTEHRCDEPWVCECFSPEIHWNRGWKKEAGNWHQKHVISRNRNNRKKISFVFSVGGSFINNNRIRRSSIRKICFHTHRKCSFITPSTWHDCDMWAFSQILLPFSKSLIAIGEILIVHETRNALKK